jgi:hypothetical protein
MKPLDSNWFLEYGWAERERVVHPLRHGRPSRHPEQDSTPAVQPEQKKRLVEQVHLKGQYYRRPAGTRSKERVRPFGVERIEGAALAQ